MNFIDKTENYAICVFKCMLAIARSGQHLEANVFLQQAYIDLCTSINMPPSGLLILMSDHPEKVEQAIVSLTPYLILDSVIFELMMTLGYARSLGCKNEEAPLSFLVPASIAIITAQGFLPKE